MTLEITTVIEATGPAAAIVLTEQQVASLGGAKNSPVVVTIADRSARLRIATMAGRQLIGLSKQARAELQVSAGDQVEVTISLDQAERTVELPTELSQALSGDPALAGAFDALSYTRRKEFARSIADAKQPATKERRLAAVLAELRQN